ncbi:MAG TPA: DUF2062 domain-containing protein [Polyangiaceae bacterium]|nr:DUF2062 domain-containing protein [Polyangiaceae bacterium]
MSSRESSNWLGALWRALRGQGSPSRLGLSVGVGLFIGCQPLYGLHLPLCLLVCLPFRLDAVVAYLAANISNPLVAPFLLFAEVELGSLLLHGKLVGFDLATARATGIAGFAEQAALGSVLLGAVLAVAGGLLATTIARRSQAASPLALARRRTRERYDATPRAQRFYVAAKLEMDPVLAEIAELGALGDVIDAGCGRGQLGLCLLELGHAKSVSGFDFDAEKVQVAQTAARGDADFRVGNLLEASFAAADAVLLIDVLHYLTPSEQERVIARASACLRAGGRLVVREADGAPGIRSAVTRGLERVATRVGYNRVAPRQALGFRPLAEIVAEMRAQGLVCDFSAAPSGARLGNRLVIGRKPG